VWASSIEAHTDRSVTRHVTGDAATSGGKAGYP
jgi:hypothetical protein